MASKNPSLPVADEVDDIKEVSRKIAERNKEEDEGVPDVSPTRPEGEPRPSLAGHEPSPFQISDVARRIDDKCIADPGFVSPNLLEFGPVRHLCQWQAKAWERQHSGSDRSKTQAAPQMLFRPCLVLPVEPGQDLTSNLPAALGGDSLEPGFGVIGRQCGRAPSSSMSLFRLTPRAVAKGVRGGWPGRFPDFFVRWPPRSRLSTLDRRPHFAHPAP